MSRSVWYYAAQMAKRTLRFQQYSIHAHLGEGVPDYIALFKELTCLSGKHRKSGRRVTAIRTATLSTTESDGIRLFLIVYTGDDDQDILLYDLAEQAEFHTSTQAGRFVAKKTRVLIDPQQRRMVIETGRGHPSAEELSEFIEDEAHKLDGYRSLELSFTPIPTQSFTDKISALHRIQAATVSLARPNAGWTDRYDQLTDLAAESNAKAIDATVRARRSEGLSKKTGLIPDLVHWLHETLPAVVNAKIKGCLDAESPMVELKLTDYVETLTFETDINPETRQPLDSLIQQRLNAHLDATEKRDD